MKKAIIYFAVLLSPVFAKSETTNTSYVWINFAECNACFASLHLLTTKVLKEIPCKVILKERDIKAFEQYNDNFFGGKLRKSDVVFSDSLYTKHQRFTSTFFVESSLTNENICEVPIKILPNYIDVIYSFFVKTYKLVLEKTVYIPESEIISNTVRGRLYDNCYVVFDPVFKKILIFDLKNDVLKSTIQLGEEEERRVYQAVNGEKGDYETYKKNVEQYKSYIPTAFKALDPFVKDGKLFVGVEIGDFVFSEEGVSYITKNAVIEYIDKKVNRIFTLPQSINQKYFVDLNNPFYPITNDLFSVSISQNQVDTPYFHRLTMKTSNNSLVLDKEKENYLPDFYVRNHIYYDLTTKQQNDNYEWFVAYPVVIDKVSSIEAELDIPFIEQGANEIANNVDHTLYITDVIFENNIFKTIYYLDGTYYVGFFEANGKKINIVAIDKPAKYFSTSLRFYNQNKIASMAGGNRIEIFSIK